jgi:putative NADPH-quinone reductase
MSERPELQAIKRLVLSSLILLHATELRGEAVTPSRYHAPARGAQTTAMHDGSQNTKQLQFKILLAGEIEDQDKVHLAITNYLASDGVGVTVIHKEFPSPATAQEYFDKVLAKALKATERGEKKDGSGKVVGKRARVIVPTGKPDKPIPALLLTFGKDFYEIQTYSSRHSRIMEMRLTSSN